MSLILLLPAIGKQEGSLGSPTLVGTTVKEKENFEFKSVEMLTLSRTLLLRKS